MLPSHLHVADFGIFAVVALFALVVALLCLFDFRKSSKGPTIPGPDAKDPINGNLPDMNKCGSLHQYMVHLHKIYGPVVSFMWGTTNVVSVADPQLWKDIRSLFDRPVELFKLFEPLFGKKSIQYANGIHGRKLRQVFDRRFTHEAVKDYYKPFIKFYSDRKHGFHACVLTSSTIDEGDSDGESLVEMIAYLESPSKAADRKHGFHACVLTSSTIDEGDSDGESLVEMIAYLESPSKAADRKRGFHACVLTSSTIDEGDSDGESLVEMIAYLESPSKAAGKSMAEEWASLPENEHIPLGKNLLNIAIQSIGEAGMGNDFTEENAETFAGAYHTCWNEMEALLTGPLPGKESDRQKAFDKSREILRDITRTMLRKRSKGKSSSTDRLFIDAILECDFIDEQEMEDDMITFLIGGFHTTGNMMTWCFYYLALHPDVQDKVYQELISVLGDEDIDPMVASKLTYSRQVLDETLRCGVVAPWGARVEFDHDLQIGEYVVTKGTPILTPFGVVLQDPELYPEPQRFDPDRFSPEAMKELPSHAFEPFGFAGKRKCPAWRFSIAEGLVFLSIFVRRFKLKLVEGQKVEPTFGLVTSPKEEIWVTAEKR